MKIAFVNDCVERQGVEYISAVLKKSGHEVALFSDPQLFSDAIVNSARLGIFFDYKKILLCKLKDYQPDLVAFSVDTESYQWAIKFAGQIKKILDIPIVFGGIHPTSVPERVLSNPSVDIVCIGEGEHALLELTESLKNGHMDLSIKNLWFKQNDKIVKNPLRPLIQDLDELPIRDKELFYNNSPHFRKGYSIIASRGCPYACSYCCHSVLRKLYLNNGKYFRFRSVKSIIEELSRHASKYKFDIVAFHDDCFGCDINWLKEFTKEYYQKIKIKFTCTTYPNLVTKEYLSLLEEAGCCSITLGIQSWDSYVCNEWFNRNITSDSMIKAIRLIKETKIQLVCDNIFDVPGQDNEKFMNSLLNYTAVKPNRLIFNKLKYYPNCSITDKSKKESFISDEKYEQIMEGRHQEGACLNSISSSNDKNKKESIRIRSFLYIMDIFPKSVSKYIIKNRLYRYFPGIFNPAIFYFHRILFSLDHDTKLFKKRAICRYNYYVIYILWLKLKSILTRKPYYEC